MAIETNRMRMSADTSTNTFNTNRATAHRLRRWLGFTGATVDSSSIIQDIKNAGAVFVDREVVEDGNLVSSRNPGDLPAFIGASLKKLK